MKGRTAAVTVVVFLLGSTPANQRDLSICSNLSAIHLSKGSLNHLGTGFPDSKLASEKNALQTLCLTLLLVGSLASVSCLFNQNWSHLFFTKCQRVQEAQLKNIRGENLRMFSVWCHPVSTKQTWSELLHLIQAWLVLLVDNGCHCLSLWVRFSSAQP